MLHWFDDDSSGLRHGCFSAVAILKVFFFFKHMLASLWAVGISCAFGFGFYRFSMTLKRPFRTDAICVFFFLIVLVAIVCWFIVFLFLSPVTVVSLSYMLVPVHVLSHRLGHGKQAEETRQTKRSRAFETQFFPM